MVHELNAILPSALPCQTPCSPACEQGHDLIVMFNGVTLKVERSWKGNIAVHDAFGKVNRLISRKVFLETVLRMSIPTQIRQLVLDYC